MTVSVRLCVCVFVCFCVCVCVCVLPVLSAERLLVSVGDPGELLLPLLLFLLLFLGQCPLEVLDHSILLLLRSITLTLLAERGRRVNDAL